MNAPLQHHMLEPLELTTLLIRHFGIHRGLWTLSIAFHTNGHNYASPRHAAVFPAVVASVTGFGLRPVEVADELTVDAAAVNPPRDRR